MVLVIRTGRVVNFVVVVVAVGVVMSIVVEVVDGLRLVTLSLCRFVVIISVVVLI